MILFPSLESDGGEFLTLVSQVSRLAELVWRGEWGAGPSDGTFRLLQGV